MKLILFDLDGVLVDTVTLHYKALNMALEHYSSKYVISADERMHYEGKKTEKKLKMLTSAKGLPVHLHRDIKNMKDECYQTLLNDIQPEQRIIDICNSLVTKYELGVCSNSNEMAVNTCLRKAKIRNCFSIVLSSDDVVTPKPHPEIYLKAMKTIGVDPTDTLIIEDSPQGVEAAYLSQAHVLQTEYQTINLKEISAKISV